MQHLTQDLNVCHLWESLRFCDLTILNSHADARLLAWLQIFFYIKIAYRDYLRLLYEQFM